MIADAKPMFAAHPTNQLRQRVALKLNQLSALSAVEVIVLWIAVIVFVNTSPVQLETVQQPGVDELFKRPVDRRLTDVVFVTLTRQIFNQRVSIEMLVPGEHLLNQETTLLGLPQPTNLKVLFKPLLRRQGDVDVRQRSLIGSHRKSHQQE